MPPSNWIPVSERLPENDDWVIALSDGTVTVACYLGSTLDWVLMAVPSVPAIKSVTHWQPLPDPPEKEKP